MSSIYYFYLIRRTMKEGDLDTLLILNTTKKEILPSFYQMYALEVKQNNIVNTGTAQTLFKVKEIGLMYRIYFDLHVTKLSHTEFLLIQR